MDKEKVEAKVRALLSKTVENGATEGEMDAAMAKAAELMAKHGITKLREKGSRVGFTKRIMGPFAKADAWLGNAAANLFACRLGAGGKNELGYFMFLGEESQREAAKACFASLRLQVAALARARVAELHLNKGAAKQYVAEFRQGAGLRILARVSQWIKEAHEGKKTAGIGSNALVVRDYFQRAQDDIVKFMQESGTPTIDGNHKLNKAPEPSYGRIDGYQDGAKVEIQRGTSVGN